MDGCDGQSPCTLLPSTMLGLEVPDPHVHSSQSVYNSCALKGVTARHKTLIHTRKQTSLNHRQPPSVPQHPATMLGERGRLGHHCGAGGHHATNGGLGQSKTCLSRTLGGDQQQDVIDELEKKDLCITFKSAAQARGN